MVRVGSVGSHQAGDAKKPFMESPHTYHRYRCHYQQQRWQHVPTNLRVFFFTTAQQGSIFSNEPDYGGSSNDNGSFHANGYYYFSSLLSLADGYVFIYLSEGKPGLHQATFYWLTDPNGYH